MSTYLNFYGQAMPVSAAPVYWAHTTAVGQTLTGVDRFETLRDSLGGSPTLIGETRDTTFNLISPTSHVQARAGAINSVIAYRGFTLPANVQNLTVMDAHSTGQGNSLNNLMIARGLNDTLIPGAGNDVMVDAGSGQSIFSISTSAGKDVIYGFKVSGTNADKIVLTDPSISSFAEVRSHMTQQGSDTLLALSSTTDILLKGVTATSLTASDFGLRLNTAGMTPTFVDTFSHLSLYNPTSGSGTWKTNFAFGIQSGPGDWNSRTELGNAERQLYVDSAYKGSGSSALGLNPFWVSNGVVGLHAAMAPSADVTALHDYKYTSGLLTTEKSFAQLYGYFEIRAELPNVAGAWPAFWMLPEHPTSSAELDVMEDFGGGPIHQTVIHGPKGSPSQTYFVSNVPNDGTSFHTYGVLWTAKEIDFYIDGVNVGSTATPSDMNTPMYMLVNMAVGGISGTPGSGFSQTMKVDYVHAFSLSAAASSAAAAPAAVHVAASAAVAAPTEVSPAATSEHATAVNLAGTNHLTGDHAHGLPVSGLFSHDHLTAFAAHLQDHIWA
ncbi:glycoside hydrolase family 16 protein [Phenylobacterium montanum]|uniref:Glycoside hydrolase family 16 protein n=1 Tax=Phenylobacterium montanum TaxID=2823693 RepID=A0A975FWL6_9CAUL|nr:glycoside hydrolase family 16 protein [Caulobacter sp. S6]QUD86304.1 glycoside hydrolase family 16 protein [Caulobacter sp. S6]